MKSKREGLVPIGEVFSDLGGPVKSIREATPQARHHFTQADQVDQLIRASEADPDLGFMARLLALCSLPRTNLGNRKRVCPPQRTARLSYDCRGAEQAPLRQSPPPAAGLGLYRSSTDPKTASWF